MKGAVAVDLGATSGRSSLGWMEDGVLNWELIEQVPHAPRETGGRLRWDLEVLLGICQRALAAGRTRFDEVSFGIDCWGVDFAIVDSSGRPLEEPVCYRDPQHAVDFEAHADWREFLYAETGIQHQPFNTIYQLLSRPAGRIRFLPDLLGDLTFGVSSPGAELTIASTSQLLNLRGKWSAPIFDLVGRPLPTEALVKPGTVRARSGNATLVAVGGHDTASAVVGLAPRAGEAFLNVGTWSLLGRVIDEPRLDDPMFTNERAADGRVRYLANIPGFWVANRVHEELGLTNTVPEWLSSTQVGSETPLSSGRGAGTLTQLLSGEGQSENPENAPEGAPPPAPSPSGDGEGVLSPAPSPNSGWGREPSGAYQATDLFHERFFNPTSMLDALSKDLERPQSPEAWALLTLNSMVAAVHTALDRLEATGPIDSLVLGGGGAPALARHLEERLKVRLGPREATLEGNLLLQLESQA